jgi:hypothetical protein
MSANWNARQVSGLVRYTWYAPAGLCLAHLGRIAEAEEALTALKESGPASYADLYLDVGVALLAMGQYASARTYLQGLLVSGGWFMLVVVAVVVVLVEVVVTQTGWVHHNNTYCTIHNNGINVEVPLMQVGLEYLA